MAAVRHVNMSIDQLARYIFIDHDSKLKIDLSVVQGLETTKDLFCFCLDLLCKGLVLLFGVDNRVVVEELSQDQFEEVNNRLKLLGIECILVTTPLDTDVPMHERLTRMAALYASPENLAMSDYKLELVSSKAVFTVSFNVFHNTGSRPCPRA